jgi:hypothetical protein
MNLNIMTKKLALFLILFFLFLTIVPALAETKETECKKQECESVLKGGPIVCCGNPGFCKCTFDDFFDLINRLIDFILFQFVPPLAILWFVFGGVTMMTASGDPSKIEKGKKMITYGVIGVLLVYSAWLLVYEFVNYMTGGDPWPLKFFK